MRRWNEKMEEDAETEGGNRWRRRPLLSFSLVRVDDQ